MYQIVQTPQEKEQEAKIDISWLEMTKPYTGSKLCQSMFRGYFNLAFIFSIFFIFVYPILNYWDKKILFGTEIIQMLENNLVLDLIGLCVFVGICLIGFLIPQQFKKEASLQITFVGVILLCLHYLILKETSSYSDRTFIVMLAWGYVGKLYSYFNVSDGTDTLKNKLMFLLMPDLVYTNNIDEVRDKTLKINKLYLAKKCMTSILALLTNCVIIVDFINPIIKNKDNLTFLQLMFKMIPPSFYLGISLFYLINQNVFSGIAELLKFKKRKFFEDWWNAKNFQELLFKSSTIPKEMIQKHIPQSLRIPIYLLCAEIVVLQCFKKQFTLSAGILYLVTNFGIWMFGRDKNYFGINNYLVHIALLCFMPFILALELKYKVF